MTVHVDVTTTAHPQISRLGISMHTSLGLVCVKFCVSLKILELAGKKNIFDGTSDFYLYLIFLHPYVMFIHHASIEF
jgi:hypothetical protein